MHTKIASRVFQIFKVAAEEGNFSEVYNNSGEEVFVSPQRGY
jgi:hypothetical protein